MNIFIVGNAGFVGSFLTRKLASCGHKVIGFDVVSDNPQSQICECLAGDICDKETIIKALRDKKIDIIIDLAAKHHDFGISKEEFFEVNEKGTKNLIECAAMFNIKKFVFFSSVAVYGYEAHGVTESTPLNPNAPYGRSKLAGEKIIEEWVKEDSSREALIIRPVIVFGPKNYGNMYNLIKKIDEGKFVFVGKGNNIKSIAYIDNIVAATLFLLEKTKPGIDYFNYSDEPQLTTREIIETIYKYADRDMPRLKIPVTFASILAAPFDLLEMISGRLFPITAKRIKKFNTETFYQANKIREIGFKQPIFLEEGFKRTLEWFREKNDKYHRI